MTPQPMWRIQSDGEWFAAASEADARTTVAQWTDMPHAAVYRSDDDGQTWTLAPTPSDSQDGARRRDDAEPLSLDQAVDKIKGLGETILWFDQQRELLFAQVNGLRATLARLEAERDEARAELKRVTAERILSVVFGHHKGAPKPFALYRREDATGVSGTGVVATGVEFEDGMVVLRWSSAFPTSVVFHERGMESVEAIHGHGGKTVVVWLSDELGSLAEMETERDNLRSALEAWRATPRSSINAADQALLATVDRTAPSSPLETPHTADGGEAGVVEGAGGSEAAEACPHRNRRCPRCRCVLDAGHDGDHDVHCGNGGGNG